MLARSFVTLLSILSGALVASAGVEAAAAAPKARPILVELSTGPIAPLGPTPRGAKPPVWNVELVVFKDGSFIAERVGPGQLAPAALKELKTLVARTKMTLGRRDVPMCTALPRERMRVRAKGLAVTWNQPCSRGPSASVETLVNRTRELVVQALPTPVPEPVPEPLPVPEPPPVEPIGPPIHPIAPAVVTLVSYIVQSFDSMDGSFVTVMSDGSWSSGRKGSGKLDGPALQQLRAQLAAATFGPAPFDPKDPSHICAARLEGEATLDAPGLGRVSWMLPCGRAHPSLGGILSTLRSLAGK